MAQIQDVSTPDPYEIMATDLEDAQRRRFADSESKYDFFLQIHELEVLEQIHHFRSSARIPVRRRGGYPRPRN